MNNLKVKISSEKSERILAENPKKITKKQFIKCDFCGSKESKKIVEYKGYYILECKSCGLIYVGNPPSDSERKKSYNSKEFQKKSNKEKEKKIKIQLDRIEQFIKKGILLDVGCSKGFFLKEAKRRGWKVKGIELSKSAADFARKINKVYVKNGEINIRTFKKGEFDLIYLGDVIEHLISPSKDIKNLRFFLKSGGFIFITTPNSSGLFPKISKVFAKRFNLWTHCDPPGHLFQFSRETLIRLLISEGFEILKFYDNNYNIESPLANFKARQLYKTPKGIIYLFFFIPLAIFGQLIKQSASMSLIARKN